MSVHQRSRELQMLTNQQHEPTKSSRPSSPRLIENLDDDQILSATAPFHEPPKAARKAALRAEKLSHQGRHEEAIQQLQNALALDPLFYEAENNLALEYLSVQQPDRAVECLRHLTKTFSGHVFVYNNLGSVLCKLQHYPEAEAVAREALRTHPYSFKAHLILGRALVGQGRWSAEAKHSLTFASVARPEAKTLLSGWPSR
jgi:tetratricopeptide (TPR) repeat protein